MAAQRKRRGGRAARRKQRLNAPIVQRRYITRDIPLYELLDAEGIEIIHENSMTILEEIGVEFRDDDALERWRAAGAKVSDSRVRIPRELAMATLALAPSEFTQHARNPERNIVVGGRNTVFAPTYGSPFVRDLDGERRYGTLEDLQNFVKLT